MNSIVILKILPNLHLFKFLRKILKYKYIIIVKLKKKISLNRKQVGCFTKIYFKIKEITNIKIHNINYIYLFIKT